MPAMKGAGVLEQKDYEEGGGTGCEIEAHMPPPRSPLPLSAQWGPEMGTEVPSRPIF